MNKRCYLKTFIKPFLFAFFLIAALGFAVLYFSGCGFNERQARQVSHNVSKEADNFNVIRRFVAINMRTDEVLFECVGVMSFEVQSGRVILIAQTGKGEYKKHSIAVNENVFWNIEDVSGASVSPYKYEVNFQPKSVIPITFGTTDGNETELYKEVDDEN
jgi:hypothetical protein